MTVEERIRVLYRIACRAEGEGDERAARLFRLMAEEARPLDAHRLVGTPRTAPWGGSG